MAYKADQNAFDYGNIKKMTSYISYTDSISLRGTFSYSEVSDKQISHFLDVPLSEIAIDDPMLEDSETHGVLLRVLYQVNLLRNKKELEPFEIVYQRKSEFPQCPDIYDGWHRIRACQYMKYERIPCYVIKLYPEDAD